MSFISQTVRPSSTPDIVLSQIECDVLVMVGDWVRIGLDNVAIKAVANSVVNSEVFGLVESKQSAGVCSIRVAGVSKAIFTGLNVEKSYFLSSVAPGQMSTTIPSASGNIVLSLGRSLDGERFLVQPTMRLQRA